MPAVKKGITRRTRLSINVDAHTRARLKRLAMAGNCSISDVIQALALFHTRPENKGT